MTLKERKDYILNNPASSYWLKNQLIALEQCDPCDVMSDLEALLNYFDAKINDIMGIKD